MTNETSDLRTLLQNAINLKDDETATEHVRTLAAAINALSLIVNLNDQDATAQLIRNRSTLTDTNI